MDSFWKPDLTRAAPLAGAPDFHVLIAGLSARQAVSATVRLQATLTRGAAPPAAPLVSLFADGASPDPAVTAGSFRAALTPPSDR